MDRRAAALAYKQKEVIDASPVKAVAILYDKAIEALNHAIRAINEGDVNLRCQSNRRACDIIVGLAASLDEEKGGEIAYNLGRLYKFMLLRLMYVDLENNPQPAQEVIGLLDPLRQSWHQLAEQVDGEQAKTAAANPAAPAAYAGRTAQRPAVAEQAGAENTASTTVEISV